MMISRRQSIAGGAALVAALAARPLMARCSPKLGLELYTVRDIFQQDPMGTLEKVAAIGYREVEFAGGGYDKMDHVALRKTMDRVGLVAPSLQVTYEILSADFDGSVKMAKTLGADTIVVAWVNETGRTDEGWKIVVSDFNRLAARLKKVGLGFAYHNHNFEFAKRPNGASLFDTLTADTDPALVKLELDIGWVVEAGADPKAIIASLPGRIYAYHVKDRTATGDVTNIGQGVINLTDIFTLNRSSGVEHFYVEIENAAPPYFPDAKTSFEALKRLCL